MAWGLGRGQGWAWRHMTVVQNAAVRLSRRDLDLAAAGGESLGLGWAERGLGVWTVKWWAGLDARKTDSPRLSP